MHPDSTVLTEQTSNPLDIVSCYRYPSANRGVIHEHAETWVMSTQRSGEIVGMAADGSVEQDTALLVKAVLANRPMLFASEVQQLCFCGDLYAVEAYDRRLSEVTYEANMYGPYSGSIESALKMLVESGEVLTKAAIRGGRRNEKYVLADPGENATDDFAADLSGARVELVRHVCEVMPTDTDRLQKVVVDSRPYRNAPGGKQIEFETSAEGLLLGQTLSGDTPPNIDRSELLPLH